MPSPSASSAPSAPTVTTTGAFVRRASARAAAAGSVSPVSAAASSPFGVSRTPCPSTPPGRSRAGAGLRIARAPASAAARAPATTAASGTSKPSSTTSPGAERRRLERARHERRVDARVRPRGDRDLVAPLAVDRDQRDAGRLAVEPRDRADVDALGGELLDRGRAEVVVADRAREPHARAGAGRGDRLVGALAAAVTGEAPAGDGLARLGEAVERDDEVGVDRADHEHRARHGRGG